MNISFSLKPTPPFRLDLTVWTLRRRANNITDQWNGSAYCRVLVQNGEPLRVRVSQVGPADSPRLLVHLEGRRITRETRSLATRSLERLLGLRIDLTDFYRLADRDPRLGSLVHHFMGVKPPRLLTLFEALTNAIACQQITLSLGITLLNRLVESHGTSLQADGEQAHAFPEPQALVNVPPAQLQKLGLSRQKAAALVALARAGVAGALDPKKLAGMDDATAVQYLTQLRGIGRWSAEYALLRGLGRLDLFPGDDVGARGNLVRWLKLGHDLDYAQVQRVVARWQPYAGMVYFHLLLKRLEETGTLQLS